MAEGLQPHRRLGDLRVADRCRPVRRCAAQQHQDAHPVANRPASPVCPRPAPLELEPWHPLPCPVIEIVRSTFALTLSSGHHPAEGDSDSLRSVSRGVHAARCRSEVAAWPHGSAGLPGRGCAPASRPVVGGRPAELIASDQRGPGSQAGRAERRDYTRRSCAHDHDVKWLGRRWNHGPIIRRVCRVRHHPLPGEVAMAAQCDDMDVRAMTVQPGQKGTFGVGELTA